MFNPANTKTVDGQGQGLEPTAQQASDLLNKPDDGSGSFHVKPNSVTPTDKSLGDEQIQSGGQVDPYGNNGIDIMGGDPNDISDPYSGVKLTTGEDGGNVPIPGFEVQLQFVDKGAWIGSGGGKADGGTPKVEIIRGTEGSCGSMGGVCDVDKDGKMTPTPSDPKVKVIKGGGYVDPDSDCGTATSSLGNMLDTGNLLGGETGAAVGAIDKATGGTLKEIGDWLISHGIDASWFKASADDGDAKSAFLEYILEELGLVPSADNLSAGGLQKLASVGADGGANSDGEIASEKGTASDSASGQGSGSEGNWFDDLFADLGLDQASFDFGEVLALGTIVDLAENSIGSSEGFSAADLDTLFSPMAEFSEIGGVPAWLACLLQTYYSTDGLLVV